MIQEIEYKIGKAEGKARLPKISNRRKLLASLGKGCYAKTHHHWALSRIPDAGPH